MHRLGLDAAGFRAYRRALVTSRTEHYEISLTDLDGNLRSSIATDTLSGQVLGDVHRFGTDYGPTRRLMLDLLDPGNTLDIDPKASAAAQSLYLSTLVHVTHVLRVDELGEHVHCPLFVGRPSTLGRSDDVVHVTADDKSVLGMGQAWRPLHIGKGTPKVDAIRQILSERMGETRFDFPANMDKPRLLHSVSIGRMGRPWAFAVRIAESMDMQLFYRGNVCTLRHWPRRDQYTFDPSQEIVAGVELDTENSRFRNLVVIRGHRPHGSKHRIRAVARPHPGHPSSPESLAYRGVQAYHVLERTHPHIRSTQEAQRKAERILEDRLLAVEGDATFDIVPLPFLEEGDRYRGITSKGDATSFRLETFAFPIGGDPESSPVESIGYHKAPPPPHRKLRRKGRRRGA